MKLHKRVLKLHHFRNLGRKSPAKLLLNSSFENKHGGLVVLVGENNVGKSNVLEALKAFNDIDIKLCNENDYFKAHEKDSLLSLEEEAILDHKITGFPCVDLKIQTEEIGEGLKIFVSASKKSKSAIRLIKNTTQMNFLSWGHTNKTN